MRVYNKTNIIPAATRMNTTINSTPMNLVSIYGFSIQVVWTGTPTGSFKLQASSDVADSQLANAQMLPTNWSDVTNSSYAVTAAGNYMWNVSDAMYTWVRVVYTDTSGGVSTAQIASCTLAAKGV